MLVDSYDMDDVPKIQSSKNIPDIQNKSDKAKPHNTLNSNCMSLQAIIISLRVKDVLPTHPSPLGPITNRSTLSGFPPGRGSQKINNILVST